MTRVPPSEPIIGTELTILDFWQWAYSDVLSNGTRSVFAEFLVGTALGVLDKPRLEWDAVDLRYQGYGIEVKATGYVQSWSQTDKLSKLMFGIGERLAWDAATDTYSLAPAYSAAVYVFCVFEERDRKLARKTVIDPAMWSFYVMRTDEMQRHFGTQKSVVFSRVKDAGTEASFASLKDAVDKVLS